MMKTKILTVCIFTIFLMLFFGCHKKEPMEYRLIQEDLRFSKLSSRDGRNAAFLHYCADDAVLLAENNMPISGKQEIKSYLDATDDSLFRLTWEPLFARMSEAGDLGYTYGIYHLEWKEKDQKRGDSYGTYTTIWKEDSEGNWKFVLDTGNKGLGEKESQWENYLNGRSKNDNN